MDDQQISDKFNYGIIGPEHLELFALELEKNAEFDFTTLHPSMFKYKPISAKPGWNVCDYKISDELCYGSN